MCSITNTAQARAYLHEEARTVARRPRIKIFRQAQPGTYRSKAKGEL